MGQYSGFPDVSVPLIVVLDCSTRQAEKQPSAGLEGETVLQARFLHTAEHPSSFVQDKRPRATKGSRGRHHVTVDHRDSRQFCRAGFRPGIIDMCIVSVLSLHAVMVCGRENQASQSVPGMVLASICAHDTSTYVSCRSSKITGSTPFCCTSRVPCRIPDRFFRSGNSRHSSHLPRRSCTPSPCLFPAGLPRSSPMHSRLRSVPQSPAPDSYSHRHRIPYRQRAGRVPRVPFLLRTLRGGRPAYSVCS
jgi:hypothetical protein